MRRLACILLGIGVVAGGCNEPGSTELGPTATVREGDPPLTESWRLPPGTSALASGDLGSDPVALCGALMRNHAAAGISHRIAGRCKEQQALGRTASLALRFSIGTDGALASVEGDPPGPAATCTADALAAELRELAPLPAGAALMVLRFPEPEAP